MNKLQCVDCGTTENVNGESTGIIYADRRYGKLCWSCEDKHKEESK